MEKNIAILMADLTGYTALTETHGAETAADLIDKYIGIAQECLVGNSKLQERTGDEIMFVSENPDDLLATALKLEANTATEDNFLQVHGGMHYGKLLMRNDHYFGSAINYVSRIASKASAGSFLCSVDFLQHITDKSICTFTSKGNQVFKNIAEPTEVFEVNIEKRKKTYIDPICRMLILNTRQAIQHPKNDELYFCSSACLQLHKEHKQFMQTM